MGNFGVRGGHHRVMAYPPVTSVDLGLKIVSAPTVDGPGPSWTPSMRKGAQEMAPWGREVGRGHTSREGPVDKGENSPD